MPAKNTVPAMDVVDVSVLPADQPAARLGPAAGWRARTVLLGQMIGVFILLVPILGYSVWREWEAVQARQVEDVINRTNALAASQMTLAVSTRSLLISLSLAPAIQGGDEEQIYNYFKKIGLLQRNYSGFAFFDTQGETVAGVYEGNPRRVAPEEIRARHYFQEAIQHNRFNVSLPQPVENGLLLPMTMPIIDARGTPRGLLLAAVSLSRQCALMQGMITDSTSAVVVLDSAHNVVFMPQNLAQESVEALLNQQRSGVFLRTNAYVYTENGIMYPRTFEVEKNGRRYIGAAASLQMDESPPYMHIVVLLQAMPLAEFLFKRFLLQAVASVALVVLALWAATYVGRHCFTSGLERLAIVATSNRTGTLSMRCGVTPGCTEIQVLSSAFDGMLDEIERKTNELLLLSHTDALTELWNRRYFEKLAEHDINLACRNKRSLVFAITDIDHFKRINDTYGHAAGDKVLRCFADTLKNSIRSTDLLARYGGEEFTLLLPDTDAAGAAILLEKLRVAVENQVCLVADDQPVRITASFGAAVYPVGEKADLLQLQKKADAALYASKANGRNRVTID